jgi:hypothetical protein
MKLIQHYLPQHSSCLRARLALRHRIPITIFFSEYNLATHHTSPFYLLLLQILLLELLLHYPYLYLSTLYVQHLS